MVSGRFDPIMKKAATLRSQPIPDRLEACRIGIECTLGNNQILTLVTAKGYPAATMNEGLVLYNTASTAVSEATTLGGIWEASTGLLGLSEKAARQAYTDFAKLARAAFLRDPAALATLTLKGKAAPGLRSFIKQAETTMGAVNRLTAAQRAKLLKKGYTDSFLSQERAKIAGLRAALNGQTDAKGAAQAATATQKTALRDLVDWTMEYFKTARVVLKANPQLLEKLGIVVREGRTPAQRAAPKKAAITRRKNREEAAAKAAKAASKVA